MKSFLFSTLLVLGSAGVSVAQEPSATTAPLRMRGWMPVVEVTLNGQGPFAFMIDTGAGMQADIDTTVAERLNLRPSGSAVNGDPSGNNDREVATTTIASLNIGRAQFRNVTAIVRPQRITRDYPDVDGILGFALFSDYLLTLDYPRMQLKLEHGTLPPANGAEILDFEIENRIPIIEVAIGKIRLPAHIDSGNFVAGFILPEEIVDQLPLRSEAITFAGARSVTNRIQLKQVQLRDTIRLGRFEFPQPTIAFPAPADTNIGFKVLRDFVVTFDQKNQRVKLQRGP